MKRDHAFVRFKAKVPDTDDKINILAVDLGDGEYCVCESYLNGNEPNILRNSSGAASSEMSLYYDDGVTSPCIGEAALSASVSNVGNDSALYHTFKKPPMSLSAKQNYRRNLTLLPHRIVMQRFFQNIIQNVFDKNKGLLSKEHTIILVGRPASSIWDDDDNDIRYGKLLSEGLTVKGYNGQLHVVIYSEAEASLADEIKNGEKLSEKPTIIIDGGSSTYDAVMIEENKAVEQISWQLGAAQIEHNLYDLFIGKSTGEEKSIINDIKKRTDLRKEIKLTGDNPLEDRLIIAIRGGKEKYFGADGQQKAENGPFKFSFEWKDKKYSKKYNINSKTMRIATHEMKIRVESNGSDGGDNEYNSFADAVTDFMKYAAHIAGMRGHKQCNVVLTGGSTVMPFVREAAEMCFGKENVSRNEDPHYSVARGLAYMGCIELQTYWETQRVMKIIRDEVKWCSFWIADTIEKTYYDSVWETNLIEKLDEWVNSSGNCTIKDLWDMCNWDMPIETISKKLKELLVGDNSSLESKIRNEIRENLNNMLPVDSRDDFELELNVKDAVKKACSHMENFNPKLSETVTPDDLLGFCNNLRINDPVEYKLRIKMKKRIHNRIKDKIEIKIKDKTKRSVNEVSDKFIDKLRECIESQVPKYIEDLKPYLIRG